MGRQNMHKMHKFAMLAATLVLSACGPSQEQVARQPAIEQQNARSDAEFDRCISNYGPPPRARNAAVALNQCVATAYGSRYNPDTILMNMYQRSIYFAERYRDGFIDHSTYQFLVNQSFHDAQRQIEDRNARDRIVAAQERQARDVNCMSARQNNMYRDESGLNSTNGAVAIISLLGVIGGAMNQAAACR
jgi:hypothetical protein